MLVADEATAALSVSNVTSQCLVTHAIDVNVILRIISRHMDANVISRHTCNLVDPNWVSSKSNIKYNRKCNTSRKCNTCYIFSSDRKHRSRKCNTIYRMTRRHNRFVGECPTSFSTSFIGRVVCESSPIIQILSYLLGKN